MLFCVQDLVPRAFARGRRLYPTLRNIALLFCSILTGCAALTNRVADVGPVRRLPPDLLATPRGIQRTIPLNLLREKQPEHYLLAPGNVVGIYIEGVLGQ